MHVGCAHSWLLSPRYRQAVQEAARHLPPGDKAKWVASWRSAGAAWTEVFCSGLVPEAAEAHLRAIARYNPPGGDLRRPFPPPHAPAWRLRVQTPQSPAGATPPRAPKRGGPGALLAHRDRGQLPPPPPPRPDRDFVASLRLMNGTPECSAQENPHLYQDLPGGFSKHLQDALFPPWAIGRGSKTTWKACIVGAD